MQKFDGGLTDETNVLLATMTGAAVLETVLRPPADHPDEELIETLAEIIDRVTAGREQTRAIRAPRANIA